MRSLGITHVRLPFGAWCVSGPRSGEPFVGPCLEALDAALDQLDAAGLLVLLDLHGPVGGVNKEAPTGHIDHSWHPEHFDTVASLDVLRVVAERYSSRRCICGLGVANEPSECISAEVLANYYVDAVRTIRQAGMRAGEVAVFLPIFTERRAPDFRRLWECDYAKYEDCVFDVHLYQCFGLSWHILTLGRHFAEARKRAELLESLPACSVTEWSLALPRRCLDGINDEEQMDAWRQFAKAQLEAYDNSATHGWFFWTWKEQHHHSWSFRDCVEMGLLEIGGA